MAVVVPCLPVVPRYRTPGDKGTAYGPRCGPVTDPPGGTMPRMGWGTATIAATASPAAACLVPTAHRLARARLRVVPDRHRPGRGGPTR